MTKKNKIDEIFIEHELVDAYLNYAMSVIVGRALPDVRDGLKPVHRRTLFVMKELNNKFNKHYKKSARIVGDVIGKYHPHGENAVYDSIVRLSQVFIQRYPLIDGQGNFGSIDGDSAAAMRYTEIRMSEITEYMMKDLDFLTVDYIFNYDNTEKYPIVFPCMFPNILINGSYGIAVGMATSIPPHNLTEVINACIAYIRNPDILLEDIAKYILAPDFPTYASIHSLDNIYTTGRGKICIRAKTLIENNKDIHIFIKEIPYQINKSKLLVRIKELIRDKIIEGIKVLRDESDKNGLQIFISIEKNINVRSIINKIYNFTNLQNIFNANILCLANNLPKLLNIKDVIEHFILHRNEIIYRRTMYVINKLKYKLHTLEVLYLTLFNINKIIKLVTKFNNILDLKKKIHTCTNDNIIRVQLRKFGFLNYQMNQYYDLSNVQIQTILDLKISKLIKFEKNFIINDYICLLKDYVYYKLIVNNTLILHSAIKNELLFIKKKFGDFRRTKIFQFSNFFRIEEVAEKKE